MNPVEWLAFFTFFVTTYTFGSAVSEQWIEERRKKVSYVLRPAAFQAFQLIFYALLWIGILEYWRNEANESLYNGTFIAYFILIILDKVWLWVHLIFPSWGGIVSVVFVLVMLAAVVTLIVFAAIASAWLSFGFFLAYGIWVLYLLVVSIQFHRGGKKIKGEAGGVNDGTDYRAM